MLCDLFLTRRREDHEGHEDKTERAVLKVSGCFKHDTFKTTTYFVRGSLLDQNMPFFASFVLFAPSR